MENQEPEIIERKLTPENFDEVKKLILENEIEFDLKTSTIKITKKWLVGEPDDYGCAVHGCMSSLRGITKPGQL